MEKVHVDVVIPVLHGLWGEDGTVQGLLELAGIPYVGCGVLASAVCMDKAVANALFEANGVPHTRWLAATAGRSSPIWKACATVWKRSWAGPCSSSPQNAGSSVGISKVSSRDELKKAIDLALENDRKVVFEAFVDGQEVECAVIGSDPAVATRPGEILAGAEFYTYDDKYKNGVSQTVISGSPAGSKAGRGEDLRRHGLHCPELRGPCPLRFLCGKGYWPGADQRDQHLPGLHVHQHVPQADGARGPAGAAAHRPADRAGAGKEGKAAWITARSAYSTAPWRPDRCAGAAQAPAPRGDHLFWRYRPRALWQPQPETILQYARQDVAFLLSKNVKCIMAACGTVSSTYPAAEAAKLPVPYLGVVDAAAREAAFATRNRRIGVIGTAATIRSRSYEKLLRQLVPGVEITAQACPLFVPLVEAGYVDHSEESRQQVTKLVIAQYLTEVREAGVDTLILGCTHYPLLKTMIGEFMGQSVTLVDPAKTAAHHLEQMLSERGLKAAQEHEGQAHFYVSDVPDSFVQTQTCSWASTRAARWIRSPLINIDKDRKT